MTMQFQSHDQLKQQVSSNDWDYEEKNSLKRMQMELQLYQGSQLISPQNQKSLQKEVFEFQEQNVVLEKEDGLLNFRESLLAIIKSGVGTGLLFSPYIFYQAGPFWAIVLLGGIPFLILGSYQFLIKVLDSVGDSKLDLQQCSEIVLGERYFKLAQAVTFLYNSLTNTVYIKFIVKSFKLVMPWLSYEMGIVFDFLVVIIIFSIYFPLSLRPHLSGLVKVTKIGLAIQVSIFFCILVNSAYIFFFQKTNENYYDEDKVMTPDSQSVILNFGTVLFLYDINSIFTSIRSEMRFPKKEFKPVLKIYFSFTFILALLLGLPTFVIYGSKTDEFVFQNLHQSGIFKGKATYFIAFIYSISLLSNIVIYFKPQQDYFDHRFNKNDNQILKFIQRIFQYLLISLIAILYPGMSSFANLLGCVFSVTLGFIFPYLLIEKFEPLQKIFSLRLFILTLGCLGGISGIVATIKTEF